MLRGDWVSSGLVALEQAGEMEAWLGLLLMRDLTEKELGCKFCCTTCGLRKKGWLRACFARSWNLHRSSRNLRISAGSYKEWERVVADTNTSVHVQST